MLALNTDDADVAPDTNDSEDITREVSASEDSSSEVSTSEEIPNYEQETELELYMNQRESKGFLLIKIPRLF